MLIDTDKTLRLEFANRLGECDYPMKPMLVPERDLKGATPEKLALALLRPRRARKPIVGDKAAVQEPSADKPGNRFPHLLDRS